MPPLKHPKKPKHEKPIPPEHPAPAELEHNRIPLIGDVAPSFVAQTTNGTIHFPEDFKGKWVILFSHPSDFTPVCTTEFIYFANMMTEFQSMNTELVGLSVDSLSSHIAWLYAIQEEVRFNGLDHVKIAFPLIADLSGDIARLYGMIHQNFSETKAVRAVFYIDPMSVVRAVLYYPSSTGRNFDEMKRLLISLQLNDALGVSTPANWQPGEDVVAASAVSLDEALAAGVQNKNTTGVWFLSTEPLSVDAIKKKIKGFKPSKHTC